MTRAESIISFQNASFEYGHTKPILAEVNFSIRRGAKFALMGQNGAGKSTILQLIAGFLAPASGKVNVADGLKIALSRQVIPQNQLDQNVREFFLACFEKVIYDIDPRIDEVLEIVHLAGHQKVHERKIRSFSGGQQARLLLASALIQKPDLLLLDEPTNNLDRAGIEHLTEFLVSCGATVLVISHDAEFLNAFCNGVLYLDIHTRKIEQYSGNYHTVVREISLRIERENRKNAQLAKDIQENKEKANFFAQKGGKMRNVAKKMWDKIETMEEAQVDVREEDKTIRPFTIPVQQNIGGIFANISSYTTIRNHKAVNHKTNIELKKKHHLLISGPNGIGKTTLLESLASGKAKGMTIAPGVKVGYYRQDFSTLNFEDRVRDSLLGVMEEQNEENMRSVAAGFLIKSDMINAKIGDLSEGLKGLVAFARLVLQKPGLLILDEPTNHINFRHLPVIAGALDHYEGAMILVSHVPDFVAQIRIDEILNLEK